MNESVDFAGEDTLDLVSKALRYRIVFSNDSYEQIDPRSVFNETWNRSKPSER